MTKNTKFDGLKFSAVLENQILLILVRVQIRHYFE